MNGGFDEVVDVLLVVGISGGIAVWIQIVEPYGNLETEVVGKLFIQKVKPVLTYSTVTDLFPTGALNRFGLGGENWSLSPNRWKQISNENDLLNDYLIFYETVSHAKTMLFDKFVVFQRFYAR